MSKIAISFDFDGVIVDSMSLQEQAWTEAAKIVGIDPSQLVDNLYKGFAGSRMFQDLKLTSKQASSLRQIKDDLWNIMWSRVSVFPGASEGLRQLSQIARLAIVSSAPREYIDLILKSESLLDIFTTIVTDADSPAPKPDPSMLFLAAPALDSPVSDIWLVGDTFTDQEMGLAANCNFLFFAPDGRSRPNIRADNKSKFKEWGDLKSFFIKKSSTTL